MEIPSGDGNAVWDIKLKLKNAKLQTSHSWVSIVYFAGKFIITSGGGPDVPYREPSMEELRGQSKDKTKVHVPQVKY